MNLLRKSEKNKKANIKQQQIGTYNRIKDEKQTSNMEGQSNESTFS